MSGAIDWWANLLQGALGSILGSILGGVVSFLIARWVLVRTLDDQRLALTLELKSQRDLLFLQIKEERKEQQEAANLKESREAAHSFALRLGEWMDGVLRANGPGSISWIGGYRRFVASFAPAPFAIKDEVVDSTVRRATELIGGWCRWAAHDATNVSAGRYGAHRAALEEYLARCISELFAYAYGRAEVAAVVPPDALVLLLASDLDG